MNIPLINQAIMLFILIIGKKRIALEVSNEVIIKSELERILK